MIRFFLTLLALGSLAVRAYGQTPVTRIRADQVRVDPSGMVYLSYSNLQTLISAVDTNLVGIRALAVSSTVMSNRVVKAMNEAAYDLVYAVALSAAEDESEARAYVTVPTNTVFTNVVAGGIAVWPLPITSTYAWASNGLAVSSSTSLEVNATGGYSINLTAAVSPPTAASNYTYRVLVSTAGGTVITGAVSPFAAFYGSPSSSNFLGNFYYPLSSGATIRAECVYQTTNVTSDVMAGGGMMTVNRTPLKDASGTTITAPLEGGW